MLNGNSSKHCVLAHYHMEFRKSEQLFDLTSFGGVVFFIAHLAKGCELLCLPSICGYI
jgi:hypothetical protein